MGALNDKVGPDNNLSDSQACNRGRGPNKCIKNGEGCLDFCNFHSFVRDVSKCRKYNVADVIYWSC